MEEERRGWKGKEGKDRKGRKASRFTTAAQLMLVESTPKVKKCSDLECIAMVRDDDR